MDLKRRLGFGSGANQNYELIRSTQSLVDRLNLNSEDISIQPVHPSIMGQDNWFSITYTTSNTTRYFSCQNARERNEWIASLRKTLTPVEDRRRLENSLKIWIYEVKGLSDKKKYYCELHLDDKIYARTSSKKMAGMCFWGEYFHFHQLPKVEKITILIYKDKGRVRRQRKPVGRIKISVQSVLSRREVEKWYPVEKASRRESPSIRLKCQYQSMDILPVREYEDLLKFCMDEYRPLVRLLESHISIKVKEEFAFSLMNVFKIQDVAEDILADIVVHEISNNDNETLTFRGNSIATKAMEAYIKMIGEKYLGDTLAPILHDILASNKDLEVDPVKVANPDLLHSHRQDLRNVVSIVWKRIANSHSIFPVPLQRCFHKIRQYLEQLGKAEMATKLISSCLFLRYLCPAILGPNLFNITDEYPSERQNRNLTLIAKTLQTLANFARYEGKENSMEFMNGLLDEEAGNMRQFLNLISGPPPDDWIHGLNTGSEKAELGKNLSHLHTILVENICKIPQPQQQQQPTTGGGGPHHTIDLDRLKSILNNINSSLHRPTTSTLDNIAEPTPVKIKRMSVDEKPTSPNISQNNVITNWMSWTLGRGEKKSKVSEPIPQHKLNRGLVKTTFYTPDVTESSSSSASLTPSPKYTVNPSPWSHSQTVNIRKNMRSVSSISIIDDSDSESSSASSQYRVDTSHPALHYTTLPRSKMENRTLADYEREIHGLRSAMETLQVKLSDAERKLQEQQGSGSTSGSDRSTGSRSPHHRNSHSPPERGGGGVERTGGGQTVISIPGSGLQHRDEYGQYREDSKDAGRLVEEENMLKRDQGMMSGMEDKELMILLQQRKIAALDEANTRLVTELNKIGEKTGYKFNKKKLFEQETPKTVDELLDSFNDTPV